MSLVTAIEAYIKELLRRSPRGWVEIRRKEIAEKFACVPSQVTYVLNTRFDIRHGYLVESRRGGGGCIRICRLDAAPASGSPGEAKVEGLRRDFRDVLQFLAEKGMLTDRELALLNTVFRALETSVSGDDWNYLKLQILREIIAAGGFR